MLHDVVQRKKFYTLVLQKCLTRSPYLDELADYLTSDDSIDKKRDAKFFIANYVLNSDLLGDCEDECLDFKEMDELVLYIIEKLKKCPVCKTS